MACFRLLIALEMRNLIHKTSHALSYQSKIQHHIHLLERKSRTMICKLMCWQTASLKDLRGDLCLSRASGLEGRCSNFVELV